MVIISHPSPKRSRKRTEIIITSTKAVFASSFAQYEGIQGIRVFMNLCIMSTNWILDARI